MLDKIKMEKLATVALALAPLGGRETAFVASAGRRWGFLSSRAGESSGTNLGRLSG